MGETLGAADFVSINGLTHPQQPQAATMTTGIDDQVCDMTNCANAEKKGAGMIGERVARCKVEAWESVVTSQYVCWSMSTEKSLAIVLRVVEFSETSIVATLFTENFGKIGALAKGARRPKSPFEAALDLLAVCRIVFIHKSTDVLDLLTEAKLERRFRSSARDLSRLYAGYYVAELLDELTDPSDAHPGLFQAANQILTELDEGEPVHTLVLRFELVLVARVGIAPVPGGVCGMWGIGTGCRTSGVWNVGRRDSVRQMSVGAATGGQRQRGRR